MEYLVLFIHHSASKSERKGVVNAQPETAKLVYVRSMTKQAQLRPLN